MYIRLHRMILLKRVTEKSKETYDDSNIIEKRGLKNPLLIFENIF